MKENKVTCSESRSNQTSSLRREEYHRSSYRLSLRRDYDSGPGRVCGRSLRRGHLAWARWFFAQKLVHSPERVLVQYSWASFCNSRLSEMSSPGREHRFAISCFTWQRHTHIPNDNQFILISRQAFSRHKNHKTEVKQPTYDKKRRTLASLTWNELAQGLDTNSRTPQLKEQT